MKDIYLLRVLLAKVNVKIVSVALAGLLILTTTGCVESDQAVVQAPEPDQSALIEKFYSSARYQVVQPQETEKPPEFTLKSVNVKPGYCTVYITRDRISGTGKFLYRAQEKGTGKWFNIKASAPDSIREQGYHVVFRKGRTVYN